jgi:hypothetical protein
MLRLWRTGEGRPPPERVYIAPRERYADVRKLTAEGLTGTRFGLPSGELPQMVISW